MKIIENNPDRWYEFTMSFGDGGASWKWHLDTSCFPPDATGRERTSQFFNLTRNLIMSAGGAIPLIVNNSLGDNWRQQLNDAAEIPLSSESLAELADSLRKVPIFITGDNNLFSVPTDVEAKIFWTLPPEQFQERFTTVPDLSQAILLVFVRSLKDIQAELAFTQCDQVEIKAKGKACRCVLGSSVKVVHEIVHAARWQKSLLPTFHWIRLDCGWGLSMEEMKKSAATPEKLVGYRFGSKIESQFPADAGRLWEHSLTGGNAVIESALVLVGVSFREDDADLDSAKEELLDESVSNEEAVEIMNDPTKLLTIVRGRAASLRAKCREGYALATYVACSRDLIRCAPNRPRVNLMLPSDRLRFFSQISVPVPGLGGMDPQQLR